MTSANPCKQYLHPFEINYIYDWYLDTDDFENQAPLQDLTQPFALGLEENCLC